MDATSNRRDYYSRYGAYWSAKTVRLFLVNLKEALKALNP